MPVYEYECKSGHVTEVLCPVNDRPSRVRCACGRGARPILSAVSFVIPGTTGATKDDDNDVREARLKHKEMVEWGTAAGCIQPNPNTAPTKDAQPTSEGVKAKKKALASGAKIPQQYRAIAPTGHYDAQP